MLVIAKLVRLIGLDLLHIGTVVGKMESERKEVNEVRMECASHNVKKPLEQNWYEIKPMFPIASGGLSPIHIPELIQIFGNNAIFQFGGGIHAHPFGTEGGARAVKYALYATLNNIPLKEYAKEKKELKVAIEKWG